MKTYKITYTDPTDPETELETILQCSGWKEASNYGYGLADKGPYSISLQMKHPKQPRLVLWRLINHERLERLKRRDYKKYKRAGGLTL
ncbi:MAG: hypothetical protein DRJ63_09560 [Thermoprotei archaeon]|nr:MAG: hypothetical protein DRJ63_09560 [Thermoprotei archaeon]